MNNKINYAICNTKTKKKREETQKCIVQNQRGKIHQKTMVTRDARENRITEGEVVYCLFGMIA